MVRRRFICTRCGHKFEAEIVERRSRGKTDTHKTYKMSRMQWFCGKNLNMEHTLVGRIKGEGCRLAGKRLLDCQAVLKKYNINFPPFFPGTLNIQLDEPFPNPEWSNIIYISQEEIDTVAPGYGEWWKFIPVKRINGLDIRGYIFRNKQHVHRDDGAELVTEDLRSYRQINISIGAKFELIIEEADNLHNRIRNSEK